MIKYCYGGTLPRRYSTWVLHDVTCSTWVLRHFARWILSIIAPVFVLYMLLVPAPFGLRLYTGLAVAGVILMVAIVNILVDTDRRAVRAGYQFSQPSRIRSQQADDKHRLAVAERRAKIAERRARRTR